MTQSDKKYIEDRQRLIEAIKSDIENKENGFETDSFLGVLTDKFEYELKVIYRKKMRG